VREPLLQLCDPGLPGPARLGSRQPVLALADALEDDGTVRRQAHAALRSIAKLQLPAERAAWLEAVDAGS